METDDTKPTLSASRILGRGLGVYFRNISMFSAIGVVGYLPLGALFLLLAKNKDVDADTTSMISFGLTLAFSFFEAIVTLVLCRVGWDALDGKTVSFSRSLRAAGPRIIPGIGTGLLVGVGIAVGTSAWFVPGVMVLVWTWIAIPICVIEKKGAFASFNRSRELLRGHGWPILGVACVVGLFDWLPDQVFKFLFDFGELDLGTYILVLIGLGAFISPIRAAISAVAYDDARELFKTQDIEAVASVFGAADADIPEARGDADAPNTALDPVSSGRQDG